ncbi:MAG: hypothetical protein O2800_07970, partial [Planctomycetota bacterium]|nr:hypothetical protein [Planctomycetota bacterium]
MIPEAPHTRDARAHRGLIDDVMNSIPASQFGMDALLRLVAVEETTDVPSACVSCGEYSTLKINPEFCAAHANTKEKMTMLILHEMFHIVLGHTRLFSRVSTLDNLVFDAVINAMLCHANPDRAFTALFRDYYDENDPVQCFLRPATGWSPTGLAVTPSGLRDNRVLAALHRKLYKDGCTYSELRDALSESDASADIELVPLLGDHSVDPSASGSFAQPLENVAPAIASVAQSMVE